MKTTPILLGLGLLAAVANAVALVVLNTGATVGAGPLLFGLSQGYIEAANIRLVSRPANLDFAEAKARQAMMISPYENTARLQLIYIDSLRNGRLTPSGVALFTQSYVLLPVDPTVAAWRLRFGLEHWDEISPVARQLVYEEAKTFFRLASADVPVRRILSSVSNPSGRLAGALWLSSFNAAAS